MGLRLVEPSSLNFRAYELRCKCPQCNGKVANKCGIDALNRLQKVREIIGFAMIVNSAYRCADHPIEKVKLMPGTHNQGIAFDIATINAERASLIVLAALSVGAKGIGVSKNFVHIDFRKGNRVLFCY